MRHIGDSEECILLAQSNLACTYETVGQNEKALSLQRGVYFGFLKLYGTQHEHTLLAANNYSASLVSLERSQEAKTLMRKLLPVARRALGSSNVTALRIGMNYARALYGAEGATLDDLREAVETLGEIERIARRVLGGAHPETAKMEDDLQNMRATLGVREAGET